MKRENGFIGRTDLYIAIIIALTATLFCLPQFWRQADAGSIVIAGRQGTIYTLSLAELQIRGAFTRDFEGKTGSITFQFDPDKGVRVTTASCPDQLCVHTGYVRGVGRTVVCLPGEIYALVQGESAGEVDATLY